jgi:hypothetical protein
MLLLNELYYNITYEDQLLIIMKTLSRIFILIILKFINKLTKLNL